EKDRAQRPPATARGRSRKTKGVARRIASFEANLMHPVVVALDEKILVKRHPAIAAGVKFHHPTADAVRIKLLVPRCIKRVGKIYSFAIAAYFHHLRSACERLIWFLWVRRAIGDAADAYRAGLLRIEGIRHVVLQKLAGSPA